MELQCPSCGAINAQSARYCSACGAATHEQPIEAERRQLTVFFCDLAGSTELAVKLDPEDLSSIVGRYHRRCAAIISALDGHLAQHLGDGVLAYFGYPISHENDAVRAVRAGLRLVAAVKQLNAELRAGYGIELSIRVGIHAGVVVMADVGTGARRERLALGSVPNLAARIQGVAPPDTVVISAEVAHLAAGYLKTNAMPQVKLRGFPALTSLYEVNGETAAQSRFEIASAVGLTPFVGQRDELERLLVAWKAAVTGEFRAIILVGEAGIGKSRRVHMLKEAIADDPKTLLELQCTPEARGSPFYPVLRALRNSVHSGREHDSPILLHELERAVLAAGLDLKETIPLLAPLLSVSTEGAAYPPSEASTFKLRDMMLRALLDMMFVHREAHPTLIIAEDLHWADASTLELIQRMFTDSPKTGALVIVTRRSEFAAPLQVPADLDTITLGKLSREDARIVAEHVAGGRAMARTSLEMVLDRSDGVPLFIEEVTKTLVETGALAQDAVAFTEGDLSDEVPPTVRGLLGSRLDRLGDAKAVVQLASVLGREFPQDVLEAVCPLAPARVRDHLRDLLQAGMLFAGEGNSLGFRHALIRDAAYATLLKATRRQYHERTADVLLEKFSNVIEARPELVARHYDRAERPDRALGYWKSAGQRALATNAHREAASHVRSGLVALQALHESAQTRREELELRSLLGMALIATEGYGSQPAEENFARAEELIGQLSGSAEASAAADDEKQFVTAWGVWAYHLVRSELDAANRSADHLCLLATRAASSALMLEARVARGLTLFYSAADYRRALDEFESAFAIYDAEKHRHHAVRFGQDPKTVALCYVMRILTISGHPELAEERLREGLEHAERCNHPFSTAYLAGNAAAIYHLARDPVRCKIHAERAFAVSEKYGFPTWLAVGGMHRGWARCVQGDVVAGLEEIRSHMGIFDWIRLSVYGPARLDMLSEAQQLAGDLEGALASVQDALRMAVLTGERWYQPELERRRGELMLRLRYPTEQAEASFRSSIELASAHGSRLFELRAANSLARLMNDGSVTRSLIEPVLSAFAVDCSVADVREARGLLNS